MRLILEIWRYISFHRGTIIYRNTTNFKQPVYQEHLYLLPTLKSLRVRWDFDFTKRPVVQSVRWLTACVQEASFVVRKLGSSIICFITIFPSGEQPEQRISAHKL